MKRHPKFSFQRLRGIISKEFTQMRRDRLTFAMMLGHCELRGYGLWALTRRGDDRMIGRVGFFNPEGWPGFEVGWTLARAAWGNGYATEGARRALAYAFDVLGEETVISVIHPENAASIRVAERIGERFDRTQDVRGQKRLIYSVARRA